MQVGNLAQTSVRRNQNRNNTPSQTQNTFTPLAAWTTPTNPTQNRAINRTALKIAAQKEMQITTTDNKGNNNNNRDDEMWAQNASKTIPIKR